MNDTKFKEVVGDQLDRCLEILDKKSFEYAEDGDRLHNFKVAASLQECSVQQALSGMMAKHTISIYDLCRSNSEVSKELWDEKITDSINYLLLLKASLIEGMKDRVGPGTDHCADHDIVMDCSCMPKEPRNFCVECRWMDICSHYSMSISSGCNDIEASLSSR